MTKQPDAPEHVRCSRGHFRISGQKEGDVGDFYFNDFHRSLFENYLYLGIDIATTVF